MSDTQTQTQLPDGRWVPAQPLPYYKDGRPWREVGVDALGADVVEVRSLVRPQARAVASDLELGKDALQPLEIRTSKGALFELDCGGTKRTQDLEVGRLDHQPVMQIELLDEIMGPDVPEFQSVVLQLHAPLMGALRTRPRGEADLERGAGGARMFLVAGFTEDRDRKE